MQIKSYYKYCRSILLNLIGGATLSAIRPIDYIAFVMKKRSCSSHGSDHSIEATKKDKRYIKFDYTNNLQCFIASSHPPLPTTATHKKQKSNNRPLEINKPAQIEKPNPLLALRVPRKYKGRLNSNSHHLFNNKLLLLEYVAQEDNPPQSKPDRPEKRKNSPKSEEEDQAVTEIVNSCMRVITQDTQHTSNPISARYTPLDSSTPNSHSLPILPMMNYISPEDYYYYMQKTAPGRNRRAISNEESKAYFIDVEKAEADGRTTIMVRNIPNKYTQDMLLDLFQKKHKKKFDFFYLPIDYNNSCNVGYAFINFIHAKFIPDFYKDFHQRKWNKFNSVKVCQVCYARIQGTAQLENHFQHSNVLQQRDRRYRPLIGMKSVQENISHLLQKQKVKHSSGSSDEC